MRKSLQLLLLALFLISCEEKTVSSEIESADPINGLPEYVIDKVVSRHYPSLDSVVTKFDYNADGSVKEDGIVLYPENINSSDKPYIVLKEKQIFCDQKKRVFKEVDGNYTTYISYDNDDRISSKVVKNNTSTSAPGDTTDFSYLTNSENKISRCETVRKHYVKYPDSESYTFMGKEVITYDYDADKDLKSWISHPYNYGKIIKHPQIRTAVTRSWGGRRVEIPYYYKYDENGLIAEIESPNNNNPFKEKYYYRKR